METIEAEIRAFLLEQILKSRPADTLQHDTPLVSTRAIDSMAMVRLIEFLEKRFHIAIAAHEAQAENFETISLMAELVREKQVA